jgi:hypothetical protein
MPSLHPDALNACNASTAASNSESAFTCLLPRLWARRTRHVCRPDVRPGAGVQAAVRPATDGQLECEVESEDLEEARSRDRGGGDGWLGWTYDDDALLPVSLMVRDLVRGPVYKSFLTS